MWGLSRAQEADVLTELSNFETTSLDAFEVQVRIFHIFFFFFKIFFNKNKTNESTHKQTLLHTLTHT